MTCFNALLHDETGADLIEYGLLASFISIAAVVTLHAIGPLLSAMWDGIFNAIAKTGHSIAM